MSKKAQRIITAVFGLIAVVAICFCIAWYANTSDSQSGVKVIDSDVADASDIAAAIQAIDDCLKLHAYYPYEREQMLIAALKAYVEATGDVYAEYYTEEEYAAWVSESNGELNGIGIQVVATSATVGTSELYAYSVVDVYTDSPAEAYGVKIGDLIYGVYDTDGQLKTIDDYGYTPVFSLIRGEAGTTVSIEVARLVDGTYQSVTISDIVRAALTTYSVKGRVSETDPSIGIVRISNFDNTTPGQLKEAIQALKDQGISKIVLDLRNNPGGQLTSVCQCLSYFLKQNDLMFSIGDKSGNVVTSYRVSANSGTGIQTSNIGIFRDLQYAVLVNGNSASAAEVFTSNMICHGICPVIGTLTYGKGIMQNQYNLKYYGYSGYLKVTCNSWLDPNGDCCQGIGLTPDIEVEMPEEFRSISLLLVKEADDTQLQRAIAELQKE